MHFFTIFALYEVKQNLGKLSFLYKVLLQFQNHLPTLTCIKYPKFIKKCIVLTVFALYEVNYGLGISFFSSISILEPLWKGVLLYYNHIFTTTCLK